MMSPQNYIRTTSLALALSVISAIFSSTAYSMVAGRADFVVGKVEAVTTNGIRRNLVKGSEINTGDTINTSENARAQIRFSDGGYISLQPGSIFRVDEFNFQNKTDGGEKGFFSLLKGGLRAITGLIGRTNRDTYRVTTPVATIGIRGTGYNATLGDGLMVYVGEGAISLTNNAGLLVVTAGGSAYVANRDSLPVPTTEQPQLPATDFQPDSFLKPLDTKFISGDVLNPDGSPIVLPKLPIGNLYTLAYAYMQCSDGCYAAGSNLLTNVDAEFNNTSQLLQYKAGTAGSGALGSALVSFSATDGIIGWGRWDGSTVNPQTTGGGPHPLTDGAFHYVIGIPTATMPTSGTATYTLLGATIPTATDGSLGWITSGILTANFVAIPSVGVNLQVSNALNTYRINRTMAITDAEFSGTGLTTVGLTITSCASGCTSSINGFFAGENATRAGLTYNINDNGVRNVQGAATFASGGS